MQGIFRMGKKYVGNSSAEAETWGKGEFFEAISNIELQLHLEMHARICPEREVVIARSNNGKANYDKSLLNFGAN